LREAERRLLELTGDGVDFVVLHSGESYMQQKMQEDLRHSEERYRTLVDWSRDAIVVQRLGKMHFVNPTAIKMMAVTSASDLIGKSALELVHPDFREAMSQRLNAK